jgi:hypothetical protein
MTPAEEVELFQHLGGRFEVWVDAEMAEAVKYLVSATDPVALRRAQGTAALLEKMKKLIAKGKTLR